MVNHEVSRRKFIQLMAGTSALMFFDRFSRLTTYAQSTLEPVFGGEIRIAVVDGISTFDPATLLNQSDMLGNILLGDTLVTLDVTQPSLPIVPRLAESWSTSEDDLTWTFNLRKGVKFHNGLDFTSADVVYTYNRLMDENIGSLLGSLLTSVNEVVAIDTHTVEFRLSQPHHTLVDTMWDPTASIVQNGRSDEELATTPIGTGPFIIGENIPDESVTFVRNEAYWNAPLPYLDTIQYRIIPDPTSQVAALAVGDVDILYQVSPTNIPILQANPNVNIVQSPAGFWFGFEMLTFEPPFNDVRVRKALKMATNREAIRQVFASGDGYSGNDHPISPASPYWDGIEAPAQDIEGAKALLAEAGYPDGIDITLTIADLFPGLVNAGVVLQESLLPAGIRIEIERVPANLYWAEYWGQVPFGVQWWSNIGEPETNLSFLFTSDAIFNVTGWANADFDALIKQIRATENPEERKPLYAEAQRILSEEGALIIPLHADAYMAKRKDVMNLLPEQIGIFQNLIWKQP